MSAVPTTAARNAAKPFTLSRVLARRLALPALFAVAVSYHAWQSLGHATPTVFNDELLYGKLSQAIAEGHLFSLRGEHYFFPAILAPLVQSPAWLLGSTMDAYTAAKLINAALMSAAVFPAYWLAARIVRPSYALLTAAAAVATPALFYHGYLMSEALAYPVFLAAIAVLAHAVQAPSRRMTVAVPLICLLAVATRVQFLVLPLGYLAAVAICGRGQYRRHLASCGAAAAVVVLLLGVPGALGQYGEARHLGFSAGGVAHWAVVNGYLLMYSIGLIVVVGALFGLGFMLGRPRTQFERAVAALTLISTVLFIGQAAMIGGGEASRPLERYLFYVTPLLFLAFFAYAERGAPWRRELVAVTCLGALALSQVSFPGLTGTGAFFFDSVTLSAFARAAFSKGLPEASLVYSLAPIGVALLTLALPLRRRGVPEVFALIGIALMFAMGAAVYATDRLATDWSVRTFGSSPPDWLDRMQLGPRALSRASTRESPPRHLSRELEPNREGRDRARHCCAGHAPPPRRARRQRRLARDRRQTHRGARLRRQRLRVGDRARRTRRRPAPRRAGRLPRTRRRARPLARHRPGAGRLDRDDPPLPRLASTSRRLRTEAVRPGRNARRARSWSASGCS